MAARTAPFGARAESSAHTLLRDARQTPAMSAPIDKPAPVSPAAASTATVSPDAISPGAISPSAISAGTMSPGAALLATAASAPAATREGRAHRLIIGTLAVIALIDALWLQRSSFRLDLGFLEILLPVGGVLLLLWGFYSVVRPAPSIAHVLLAALELLFFTHVCGIFSYLLMGIGWPWRDEMLATWDRFLGFDWVAYVKFTEQHPWLYVTVGALYNSTILQLGCLVLILGFSGRTRELPNFLAMIIFGGVITIIVGAMIPANSAYRHFGLADHGLITYVADTIGAHDRTISLLDPRHFQGIVNFPSYHTLLSIAIIIASWPLRYLRYPFLLANLLLLAGVPVFGGHYLTDMIGGAMAAAATCFLWRSMMRRAVIS